MPKMEKIRYIDAASVAEEVEKLFLSAVTVLPEFASDALRRAAARETSETGKKIFETLNDNLDAAGSLGVPICQDTGMAVVFADVGRLTHISGGTLEDAVNEGVRRAYAGGALRLSVVDDPLYSRKNTNDNTPAVIHIRFTEGDKLVLTAAPKGFGSENMSALKMMTPSADEDDVVRFVTETVRRAGANPCPPIWIGVGIGGDFESSALLAKRALLREEPSDDCRYAALEERIKDSVNALGIGPQGFGGSVTCLGVFVERAPTHIAGLPVAVNINCHVSRHKTVVI